MRCGPKSKSGSGVSVPFDAGRGLMLAGSVQGLAHAFVSVPFDAGRGLMHGDARNDARRGNAFQYPSMRVVD